MTDKHNLERLIECQKPSIKIRRKRTIQDRKYVVGKKNELAAPGQNTTSTSQEECALQAFNHLVS